MLFQSNVFAADEDWSPVTPTHISNFTANYDTFQFESFGGFQLYYIPVHQGQKIGIYFEANRAFEIRYGCSVNVPSVGGSIYSMSKGNYSSLYYRNYDITAPIDGYFYFAYYPSDAGSLAIYTQDSVSGAIQNQTNVIQQQTQVIQNQTQVIQDQTNAINNQTNTLNNSINSASNNIVNSITDTNFDNTSMNVDVSDFDSTGSVEVDNFLLNLLNTVYDTFFSINSDVSIIEIPLPYTEQKIVLRSDIISRYIEGTFIYTIIQTFWYFFLGSYLVMFTYRIYSWLSTGEIAEKGVVGLIKYLESENVVIKTYMM